VFYILWNLLNQARCGSISINQDYFNVYFGGIIYHLICNADIFSIQSDVLIESVIELSAKVFF
jgi:hypothetical protein